MLGVARAETLSDLAVHHHTAEPQRHRGDTVLRRHGTGRIEVVRAGHAGHVWVEAVAVRGPHQFLHDHRHLLFFRAVRSGPEVVLGVLAEGGCVHALDGRLQLGQAHAPSRVVVGQHVGLVDAGQRLILGVLEQARGADGQRVADQLQEGGQIADRRLRGTRPPGTSAGSPDRPSTRGRSREGGSAPGSGRTRRW